MVPASDRPAHRSSFGLEALVRWQHRDRGLLLTDTLLPLALATGLMQPLTEHMLAIASEQLRRWRHEDLALSVAVNIDAGALLDTSLADKLEVLLAEHGLPANAVTLEITEDSFITNRRTAIAVLVKVRALGLRVSLDDYGTGYSSLSYLRDLPIDEIKIDRSFIHDMETTSEPPRSLLRRLISLTGWGSAWSPKELSRRAYEPSWL